MHLPSQSLGQQGSCLSQFFPVDTLELVLVDFCVVCVLGSRSGPGPVGHSVDTISWVHAACSGQGSAVDSWFQEQEACSGCLGLRVLLEQSGNFQVLSSVVSFKWLFCTILLKVLDVERHKLLHCEYFYSLKAFRLHHKNFHESLLTTCSLQSAREVPPT